MNQEERMRFRIALRRDAMNFPASQDGLEWADDRVREAILEENSGPTIAYMVVVQRAITAQTRAVENQGRKAG